MKHSYIIMMFALLLINCDSQEVTLASEHPLQGSDYSTNKGILPPFNTANAYDIAGQVHSDIFLSYYDLPSIPSALDSIIALVDSEMEQHAYYQALPNFNYHQFSISDIDSIISYPSQHLTHALNASVLSLTARTSFEAFISELFVKIDASEASILIYNFIIDYEAAVIDSKLFTNEEKAFILTVTSIARFGTYYKDKKPKPKPNTDPDWDWLTTSIVGSVYGATLSVPDAISTALKTGIGAQ